MISPSGAERQPRCGSIASTWRRATQAVAQTAPTNYGDGITGTQYLIRITGNYGDAILNSVVAVNSK